MDVSTRPSATRRQELQLHKRLLAASFFCAMLSMPVFSAPTSTDVDAQAPDTVSSIASTGSHEIAIRIVEPGKEALALSARLTDASNNLAADVDWQIRSSYGELLATQTATEFEKNLPPGDYVIEATYGTVQLREQLTLLEGNSIAANFVLNAGGLRVLPALKGVEVNGLDSQTLIYALSGPQRGKLVAHGRVPGEIYKLAAGQYRVESHFGGGNAHAVADVRVRPGRMSAVEVKHLGGLARLSFVGSPTAKVKWDVSDKGGNSIASFEGLEHRLALMPGMYEARAYVDGEVLSAMFRISAGEQRDILLGN
jgi:hypothetical protein